MGTKEDADITKQYCNNNAIIETISQSVGTIKFHVSGRPYEVDIEDLRRAPSSRLYKYVCMGKKLQFKRPTQSFESILAYYQTGELHMPMCVCPGAFRSELKFWGLEPQTMEKCCYYKYIAHFDDQDTLDNFHQHLFPEVCQEKRPRRCLRNLRDKIWTILDNQDSKIITKMYFALCTAMVVLSVLTLALSTLPFFKRGLTKCEFESMLGQRVKTINSSISLDNISCTDPIPESAYEFLVVEVKKNKTHTETTPMPDDDNPLNNSTFIRSDNSHGRSVFDFRFDLPGTVSDESMVDHLIETMRPSLDIAKRTVRIKSLVFTDTIILAFFTLDIFMRIITCPSIRRYFLSSINAIDALVVVSSYSHLAVNLVNESESYDKSYIDLLEIFQVLRVVRLLRVVGNITGFKVLTFSMKVSSKDLFVLFLYLVLGVLIFANFIFFFESENDFASIPVGWWWAINTLTTVGYGDIVPKTLYGRIIGAGCSIFGVVMISVAIPVFVKTFMLLYQYAILYKKAIHKPEESHIYLYRQAISKQKHVDPREQQQNEDVEQ